MKGRGSQMQRIASGIVGHDAVQNVGFYRLGNGVVQVKEWKTRDQFKHPALSGKVASTQFIFDSKACDQFVRAANRLIKPTASPILPCDHFGLRADVVVKAYHRCLDANLCHRAKDSVFFLQFAANLAVLPGARRSWEAV
jgi:hypothetical protein